MESETRSRRLQRISENLDREAALELAAHTIINIQDQKDAASILFEKELFGQARSAAIAALEELGKLVATMSYLAGNSDASVFVNKSWSHQTKQRSGYLVMMIAPLVLSIQQAQTEHEANTSAATLYQRLDKDILANSQDLVSALQARLPELEQLVREVESGEIEFRRQDGLYVSFAIDEANKISTKYPRMVSRDEAAFVIDLLSMLNANTMSTPIDQLVGHYLHTTGQGSDVLAIAIPMLKKMMDDATKHLQQTPKDS